MRNSRSLRQRFRRVLILALSSIAMLAQAQTDMLLHQRPLVRPGTSGNDDASKGAMTYRYLVGVGVLYKDYVSRSYPYPAFTPNAAFAWSSVPLSQDASHPTDASREVLAKSEIRSGIERGPYYEDAPNRYRLRAEGAALVTPSFALGGYGWFAHDWQSSSGLLYSASDYALAPMVVFYPSPTLRISESFGFSNSEGITALVGNTWQYRLREQTSSTRFEHRLAYSAGPSFAYSHALAYSSQSDGIDILAFANRVEFPTSERMVFGFNANIRLSSYGGFENGNQDVALGPECAYYPSPNLSLRVALLYDRYFNTSHRGLATLNDYAMLNAGVELRCE